MPTYDLPIVTTRPVAPPTTAYLVASGDLRLSANTEGWAAQQSLERDLDGAFAAAGWRLQRAHDVDPSTGHGFIDGQRRGMDVFAGIPLEAPVVVAEAVWQYSHHVLAGLRSHRGPILLAANWSGEWPGLVGLLGLAGSLTKASIDYSTVWSVDFADAWSRDAIARWLATGRIEHDAAHVRSLGSLPESPETELGRALAGALDVRKAIIGVFDEGCMGMYNAIIDDELLNPMGIYKERLSQSDLVAEMALVTAEETAAARAWLDDAGMRFEVGTDEATELTDRQIAEQLAMYIAAVRIADRFGLDAVGIQYQQGLARVVAASDLAEGLLNNVERPPVRSVDGRELYAGAALPHFNEVDEGVAIDALVTNRVWSAMGLDPATTLHDVRWGAEHGGEFVWVFLISGSVPASHLPDGYRSATSMRQPAMFFPRGGGTLRGCSRPGEIVWSRVYVEDGALHADVGRGSVVELPEEETQRRWAATTPEWPIMHAVLHGVSQEQFMGRHKANHVQVAYGADAASADLALVAKCAMLDAMGIQVHLCGDARV